MCSRPSPFLPSHHSRRPDRGQDQPRITFAQDSTPAATPAGTPAGAAPGGLVEGVDYFPSPGPGVPAAYVRLPEPFQSVAEIPGSGSTVTALQLSFSPVVPAKDQNAYWQGLERRLGVTWDTVLVPAAAYVERVAATIAGGDLPDLFWLNVLEASQYFRQGAFADLTDYLTGDALQNYPNLARLDPRLWTNSATDGRIYQVPRVSDLLFAGSTLMFRQDWANRAGTPNPANAAEFTQLLTAFTQQDPDGNGAPDQWGLGSGGNFNTDIFSMMFRGPNVWSDNGDGTLTFFLETDEYRQALDYGRQLWDANLFHPDSAAMNISQAKDFFIAGRFGGYSDGIGGLPARGRLRDSIKRVDPTALVTGLVPIGHDGAPAVYHTGSGFFGAVAIPADRSEDRILELLRILDYFAAPTGSTERIFLDYGVEGTHHSIASDGAIVRTEQGVTEIGDMPYLIRGQEDLYFPETPGDAQDTEELVRRLMEIRLDNPTLGLTSATALERNAELTQGISDGYIAIITGREDLSSLDEVINRWRSEGGDAIRNEIQEAPAAR